MDWKQLKELIELVSEKGFAEFEVERQGFRLRISNLRPGAAGPRSQIQSHQGTGSGESDATEDRGSGESEPSPMIASVPPLRTFERQSAAPAERATESTLRVLKSPIVGTFYRSPAPDSPAFVKIGDQVEPDTVVCIIEAMKLMNEIQAEISGQIAEIYVENGQSIEFDQPLFGIRL